MKEIKNSAIGMASTGIGHGEAANAIGVLIGNYAMYKNHNISVSQNQAIRENGVKVEPAIEEKGKKKNVDEEPDIIVYEYEKEEDAIMRNRNLEKGKHKAKILIEIAHGEGVAEDIEKSKRMLKKTRGESVEAFVYDYEKFMWYKIEKIGGEIMSVIEDTDEGENREAAISYFLEGLDLRIFDNREEQQALISMWQKYQY